MEKSQYKEVDVIKERVEVTAVKDAMEWKQLWERGGEWGLEGEEEMEERRRIRMCLLQDKFPVVNTQCDHYEYFNCTNKINFLKNIS